jgi:glycosyltransferase involved in cell wall biosynthesis
MRVLMVNDLPVEQGAGAEIYLTRLAEGLAAAGDEVDIFWPDRPHAGIGKVFDLWDPRTRRRLNGRAARFRPDVVHHHNILREASISVLGAPRGVPAVLTLHDHRLLGRPDYPARSAVDRAKVLKTLGDRWWAKRRLAAVMAVSDELVEGARAAGFHSVSRVRVFAPEPLRVGDPIADARDVVFVGRLTADKGVDLLIEAFGSIVDLAQDARLVIVGEGAARAELERSAAPLGDRVDFRGWLTPAQVNDALAAARVVVIPSRPAFRREGMPLVAIEAALLGRPLVVSDDPGLVELVTSGGCGVAVAAEDASALATAIAELLDDDDLAHRLGASGRHFALANHTPDRGVGDVREVYRSVVA